MLTGSIAGDFQGPVMADQWCTKGVCFPIVSYGIATTVNGDLAATISAADSASTRQKTWAGTVSSRPAPKQRRSRASR
ncbi:hypothetical protein J2S89_004042 [Arthrobacter bambusae]|nr:hypothetical protein [Arthrobacter bambusae]MDQ0100314.1 hypothetical protein [Arthrobacter bambusae]